MADIDGFIESIVSYQETRITPYTDWRDAVRDALRLAVTDAHQDTLRVLGAERWVAGSWIVPGDGEEA